MCKCKENHFKIKIYYKNDVDNIAHVIFIANISTLTKLTWFLGLDFDKDYMSTKSYVMHFSSVHH